MTQPVGRENFDLLARDNPRAIGLPAGHPIKGVFFIRQHNLLDVPAAVGAVIYPEGICGRNFHLDSFIGERERPTALIVFHRLLKALCDPLFFGG